jgi:hypothetical protein
VFASALGRLDLISGFCSRWAPMAVLVAAARGANVSGTISVLSANLMRRGEKTILARKWLWWSAFQIHLLQGVTVWILVRAVSRFCVCGA